MSKLRNSLALDHAREMDLDDPERTRVHGEVIKQKLFLRNFYRQVYKFFVKASEDVPEGPRLELGSGGGFIKEFIPDVVTSDLMPLDEVDAQISATDLPYEDGTLSVIYMLDVFHHIQNVEQFLDEAMRALKPGGRIVMVETGGVPSRVNPSTSITNPLIVRKNNGSYRRVAHFPPQIRPCHGWCSSEIARSSLKNTPALI